MASSSSERLSITPATTTLAITLDPRVLENPIREEVVFDEDSIKQMDNTDLIAKLESEVDDNKNNIVSQLQKRLKEVDDAEAATMRLAVTTVVKSSLSEEVMCKEDGSDEDSIKMMDKAVLIAYISKLESEV